MEDQGKDRQRLMPGFMAEHCQPRNIFPRRQCALAQGFKAGFQPVRIHHIANEDRHGGPDIAENIRRSAFLPLNQIIVIIMPPGRNEFHRAAPGMGRRFQTCEFAVDDKNARCPRATGIFMR